jgi:predicted nucleic-acid-binding protein
LIALDTNILIRFLTEDDLQQAEIAARLIEDKLSRDRPGYVSVVVLCELVWTLKRLYGFSESRVRAAVTLLIQLELLIFGEPAAVRAALGQPLDFTDALIHELGRNAGCSETVTFDRRFVRLPGVRLLAD